MEGKYTWRGINAMLETMSEKQAKEMLDKEVRGEARVQIVLRLYGRFNKMRAQRERRELLRNLGT